MLCHLAAFAGYFVPLGNLLGPLLVWLLNRDRFPLVDDQGKEALNFQVSILIYSLGAVALAVLGFVAMAGGEAGAGGAAVLIVLAVVAAIGIAVFSLVMVIVAAVSANRGERFRYPLSIRLIS